MWYVWDIYGVTQTGVSPTMALQLRVKLTKTALGRFHGPS